MRTNTAEYEFSHGRQPRGYGQWAFEVSGLDSDGQHLTKVVWAGGFYSKARAQAVKTFRTDNHIVTLFDVSVLP